MDFILPDQSSTVDKAPALSCWGSLSHRIALLTQQHHHLAHRLLCCPREAMHAYSIYLLLNPEQESKITAEILYNTKPQEFLIHCFDDPHQDLFRALRKFCPSTESMPVYRTLNKLLHTDAGKYLMQCREINKAILRFFNIIRLHNLDPLVAPAHILLNHDSRMARVFHDALQVLRALNVIYDDKAEVLALQRMKKPISYYLDVRLDRCVSPISLKLNPPLTYVARGRDLSRLALRYSNCLKDFSYRIKLGAGNCIFIHLSDQADEAVACLEAGANRYWLDECEIPGGKPADQTVRNRIVELLKEAGVSVGAESLSKSMLHFTPHHDLSNVTDYMP